MRRNAIITIVSVASCVGATGTYIAPRFTTSDVQIIQTQPDITIAISGEVQQPGTYVLPWGSVVQDALTAAGGFTPTAERALVNLAEPLDAGEAIYVPNQVSETGLSRVSVNSSSASQLETLPRIGPKTAQKIIEGRPYNQIEDLLKVKGIGPKTLEGLKPLVTL